jgi:tetratricopeptide (TPR) repeat protein
MENIMKRMILTASVMIISVCTAFSQEEQPLLRKGNMLYKQKQFDKSLPEYQKAVAINPANPVAQYNFGNVLFRKQNFSEAEMAYSKAVENATEKARRENALYNKGVSLSKQKKLEESIVAYKNALKLDPNDEDARINLQKALLELKKKNESSDSKSPKKNQQKQQPKQQPKQNQSKLNKKRVEELLNALRDREKEVQQKVQQNKTRSTTNPEKDW